PRRKHRRRPERFNPTASGDPCAGLCLIDAGLYLREKLLKVGNAFQVQRHLAKANALQMLMRVRHPRDDRRAMQINHARIRSLKFFRVTVRADEHDAIAFHGNGFSARLLFICGIDVAVYEDDIRGSGGWRRRHEGKTEQQAEYQQDRFHNVSLRSEAAWQAPILYHSGESVL